MNRFLLLCIGLGSVLIAIGCTKTFTVPTSVAYGVTARVSITGQIVGYPDYVFTGSSIQQPIRIGKKEIPTVIEDELLGMISGETKTFRLTPAQTARASAYDPSLIKQLPVQVLGTIASSRQSGDIKEIDGKVARLIGRTCDAGAMFLIFDLNPLDTSLDIEYTVTVQSLE